MFTLLEQNRLRISEKKVMRRIFNPKKKETVQVWGKTAQLGAS
jgi:hypothetical protein